MEDYEHCLKYSSRLAELVAETYLDEKCDCLLLSGGIDTSFVALSLVLHGVKPKTISVVYDEESPDYHYIRLVAERLGLENIVVRGAGLVEECLDHVLGVLNTIDPVEVVCDIPLCIGLLKALEEGCRCVMTGDGGDELFFGYSFLLDKSDEELVEWVRRVITRRFSSEFLGEALGLKVVPAYYSAGIKDYVKEIPYDCRIVRRYGRVWGKFLLRLFLDKHGLHEVAWRNKTPVNIGSGFNKLLHRWGHRVSFNIIMRLYRRSFIHFPSRQHAYLYLRLIEKGLKVPARCSDPYKACPVCGRCLTGNHCAFCGASISGDGEVMVYSDETYHRLRQVMSS